MRPTLLLTHISFITSYLFLTSDAFLPVFKLQYDQQHVYNCLNSVSNQQSNAVAVNNKKVVGKTIQGPCIEDRPDYENIHGPLGKDVDRFFLNLFRSRMVEQVGVDSNLPMEDYQGLMELTAALNARFSDRDEVRKRAKNTLVSIFPSWLPKWFAILFAKPFPRFSSRMNAWATYVAGTWLMGECEVNDCEVDGGGIGEDQGLLVKRCRFLEESGCASVCVNSCKIPTQNFFMEDMGLPLTMTPDYDTFEVSLHNDIIDISHTL